MEINNQSLCDQYPVLYQNRYCYQEDVDVIIFKRNYSYVDELLMFKGMDFSTYKRVPLIKPNKHCEKAVIGEDIYVVSATNRSEDLGIIEIYSMKSGNWKSTTQLVDMRYNFSVCSFNRTYLLLVEITSIISV